MFSIPWRKKPSLISINQSIEPSDNRRIKELMPLVNGLPRPDWERINEHLEAEYSIEEQHAAWTTVAVDWMAATLHPLPHNYSKTESPNFLVLSCETESYNRSLIEFLERCRSRLMSVAKGIVKDNGFGKHVVIVFADLDSYYDYISHYGPDEGTYGLRNL